MYKYDLMISIFSPDIKLEETIKSIESSNKFVYNIKKYNKVEEKILKNSDIIIWDLEEDILKYVNKVKNNCKMILCTSKYDSKYENMAAIIIKPIDYEYVKYTVKNILNNIEVEEDLTFTNICLNTAVDSMPDMFWIKTLDGIHTLLNKEFCNVVNKSKEDVTGKDHYYIWNVSKDDPNSGADICKKTEDEVIEAGHLLNFQETVKNDKGIRHLITYKTPLYDKNGVAVGTVGIGHDITDLKNLSAEMRILLDSMPYPVLLKDDQGKIQDINLEFEKVFGLKEKDIIGQYYENWSLKTFGEERKINNEGFKEASLIVNGEKKIVELRFDDIRDVFDNVTGQVCIFRDVTIQRKLEEQIIKNSNIDYMTKLYNRRYLDKFIAEQSEGCVLTLISLDLDYFKSVNDTYGHKIGDEAIILTANILKNHFKDDLVVRMGGDEFLVVKVGNSDIKNISLEVENLLNKLNNSFQERKEFTKLSASIGVCQGTLEEKGLDILLNNSDTAMYESKQKGRSCYSIYKN